MASNTNNKYLFHIKGVDKPLSLKEFNGQNHNLATNYCYNITATTTAILADITDKHAVLTILGNDKNYIHGIISYWQRSEKNIDGFYTYNITMNSPLHTLNKTPKSCIYQNQSVLEISKQLLPHQIKTTKTYPKQEFIVQYQETDLSFLERILSQAGLFYTFIQNEDQAQLLITDDLSQLSANTQNLNYHEDTGANRTTNSIYFFNERVSTDEIYKQIFLAKTDCHNLQLGQIFRLQNHFIAAYNSNYRIICMKLNVTQNEQTNYVAELQLLRPDVAFKPQQKPKPRFHHLISATVESNSEYAYLDDKGRYHVRFSFDQSKSSKTTASCAVHAMQPTTGMHFPLHDGTEVALGFINGDMDQPIILGVIHNLAHPSPVNADNSTQNIIRTFAGNELIMEDRDGQQYISLATKDQDNQLKLDATADKDNIKLQSKKGQIKAQVQQDINIKTGANYTTQADKDNILKINNKQQILTKTKDITHTANKDISIKANQKIITRAEKDLNIKTAANLTLQAQNQLHLLGQKDITIQTQTGTIKTTKNISLQGKNVHISNGAGSITVNEDGNVTMQGPTIKLLAPTINIYGGMIPAAAATADTSTNQKTQPKTDSKY